MIAHRGRRHLSKSFYHFIQSFSFHEKLTPELVGPEIVKCLQEIPTENIRNFSIVAHIDHGKSTLADRLLEISGNISSIERQRAQHLDNLQVERERGITVKAQTASMLYIDPLSGKKYLFNLVDTPGHVDFSYEVSRSLSACQGVLLLVDSSQGIEAQTLATYRAAAETNLSIIPVLTKIDLPHAQPEETILEMATTLDIDADRAIATSAKSGIGIEEIFPAVVKYIPPPPSNRSLPTRLLLFDSFYDDYRGVVCLIQVVDGVISEGCSVRSSNSNAKYLVQEVGLLLPHRFRSKRLYCGQVGFIILGMKSKAEALIGDTLYLDGNKVEPLPGFQEAKSMVFASIYPADNSSFSDLSDAIDKLTMNDASVLATRESSAALGMGFRCGFLGLLHMEVFHQRLSNEFNMPVLITAPMVPYEIILPNQDKIRVESPSDFPTLTKQHQILEPTVIASIVTPSEYLGALLSLLKDKRGVQQDIVYLDDSRLVLKFLLPWQEVVTDFYDEMKSLTSGYATLDYEESDPQLSDIVKVDILINGEVLDALSFACHRSKAQPLGRKICQKLKNVIDRQQYEISIQAALGAKSFAKERIPPYRKDVLTKSGKTVGGGDISRKQKLLQKQKEGKKRMKTVARVPLSQEAFWSVMSK